MELELERHVDMSDSQEQIRMLGAANTIHATVDLGSSPKDLYVVLANGSAQRSSHPSTYIDAKRIGSAYDRTERLVEVGAAPVFDKRLQAIATFNERWMHRRLKPPSAPVRQERIVAPQAKSVGDESVFYLDEEASGVTTNAVLKKVQTADTRFGTKTLNVWVSKKSYGSTCDRRHCVTDAMIDELADAFLQSGSDNDIYDWVTNIYGEEWGAQAHERETNLIDASDTISILLTDINRDNNDKNGVVGYFYPKDNFKRSAFSGSNERVMFYIDSVIFANPDTSKIDWKKEIYATLAHEFQHMIHFYQKAVLRDVLTDVWLNEMLSETTEDLLATKIGHTGPRGVDPTDGSAGPAGNVMGRYPLFNYYCNDLPLTQWVNNVQHYSKVNAFGTYLVRNYGGAKVLHDILHSNKGQADALEQATGESLQTLLSRWGVAILLSDRIRLKGADHATYNTGDFIDDRYGSSIYRLGSINFYNYTLENNGYVIQEGPLVYDRDGRVQPTGIYLYKIGENLSGMVQVDFENLNGQTSVTLVTK
jgi:hypothetical protein